LIFKNPITNDLPKYDTHINEAQFDEFTKALNATNLSAKEVAATMDFEVQPSLLSYAKITEKSKLSTTGLGDYIKKSNTDFTKMSIKSKLAGI